MASDTVIPFPSVPHQRSYRPSRDTGTGRLPGTQPGPAPVALKKTSPQTLGRVVIEIDKLYPAVEGVQTDLINALGLLAEAITFLESARSARKNDPVSADRYVQRFQRLLPALFKCRKIGDGYGAVINSLHFASINQRGKPLGFDQITTVWRILKELRNRPFVSFTEALNYIGEFEATHLQVDPPILSDLFTDPEDE